jgi:hypothetical protein
MNNVENVVYRYHPEDQPAVRYHAIPSGCAGGADDLNAARSSYRSGLTALLGVDRHELPPVIEHLEAVVDRMWVRTRIGAVHRDHHADRMFLQTLLAPGAAQEQLRANLALATDRGEEPVVVLVEPTDTVASVVDQMTPRDTVVVAFSDLEATAGWAVIYGPEAAGRQDIPRLPRGPELRDMPVWMFAHRYGAASVLDPHPGQDVRHHETNNSGAA